MDVSVLWRGHLVHMGIAWHISDDFTSQLIAVHRRSGMTLKTWACESCCSFTSLPESYKTKQSPSVSISRCKTVEGLCVMWLGPYDCLPLHINNTRQCNRNLKGYKYWRRIKIIYGTLQCNRMCVSVCVWECFVSFHSSLAAYGEAMGSSGASWEFCNCFFCPWSRPSCFKSKKAISVSNGSINN